jgi:hypothetical protein
MDGPKTRREQKKRPEEKRAGPHSSRHIRFVESITKAPPQAPQNNNPKK